MIRVMYTRERYLLDSMESHSRIGEGWHEDCPIRIKISLPPSTGVGIEEY